MSLKVICIFALFVSIIEAQSYYYLAFYSGTTCNISTVEYFNVSTYNGNCYVANGYATQYVTGSGLTLYDGSTCGGPSWGPIGSSCSAPPLNAEPYSAQIVNAIPAGSYYVLSSFNDSQCTVPAINTAVGSPIPFVQTYFVLGVCYSTNPLGGGSNPPTVTFMALNSTHILQMNGTSCSNTQNTTIPLGCASAGSVYFSGSVVTIQPSTTAQQTTVMMTTGKSMTGSSPSTSEGTHLLPPFLTFVSFVIWLLLFLNSA